MVKFNGLAIATRWPGRPEKGFVVEVTYIESGESVNSKSIRKSAIELNTTHRTIAKYIKSQKQAVLLPAKQAKAKFLVFNKNGRYKITMKS